MHYQVYKPHQALTPYIKCYWTLDGPSQTIPEKQRIFPDGCMEMIFHYGDLFIKYVDEKHSGFQSRAFIHGQLREFIEIEASGVTGILGIRFQPWGLQAFLDTEVREFTSQTVNMEDCWKNDTATLKDQVLNAGSHDERIAYIENFLLHKLCNNNDNYSLVAFCVQSMFAQRGNLEIEQLARNLHIGRRQLERRFISTVGLSPKLLSRIIRFQHTLQLIEEKPFSNLTMIAYESGFYDQAHFIKDFKAFTGLNPRQYFSENLPLVKYFSLG